MNKRTAVSVIAACAVLLTVSLVTPALGGPSVGSLAKKAKKALKLGKSAKRTANAAWSSAASANRKADQALARPVVTPSGIVTVTSPTSFVPPVEVGAAIAFCPGGQRALSGGGSMISGFGDGLAVSKANDARTAWFVIAVNNSEFTTAELQATAYCAPAGGAVAASQRDVRAEVAQHVRDLDGKLE